MNRLTLALSLALAPFVSLAYLHAAKILLSGCDAMRWISGHTSSTNTTELDYYSHRLALAAALGCLSAYLLAREIAKLVQRNATDRVTPDR